MERSRGAVALLSVLVSFSVACPGSTARGPDAAPQASQAEPSEVSESIFDGALSPGWQESGSANRELAAGTPAKVRFGDSGEWTLTKPGLAGRYGGLLFRVREPPGDGEFLEVRLGAGDGHKFPSIKLKPDHRTSLGEGWAQVLVPMAELNPDGATFDRVVFHPFRPFANEALFDKIALSKPSATPTAVATAAGAAPMQGKATSGHISCEAKATKISPLIYSFSWGNKGWEAMRPGARRWGGNATTRYNWQGHFSNAAKDWFFENRGPGDPYTGFIADDVAHNVPSAITVPIIGWVAKDGSSYSFPVSVFGAQQKTDQWKGDAGNGVSQSGKDLAPGSPTRTSVAAPPSYIAAWVSAIKAQAAATGKRNVYEYILDNEPALWNSTHRDIRPNRLTYDELLDRTIQYASAIRAADPEALIAGPAEWGWTNYFWSDKDMEPPAAHLDRLAHGSTPLVEWYLAKLREHEQKTGTRLLDVLDLHYYPQGNNVFNGGGGGTDRGTQLLRLRQTRGLWDPKYVDESWINEPVRLLPRMKEWVDKNYPGRGISIGEWNFGGEKDITGALATAESLGRFAQFGVASAFYWTAPDVGTASSFGFLAYRNFDNKGGAFLDWYVPSTIAEGASVFASRDAETGGKHLVVVALNMSPNDALAADLDVSSCGALASRQAYTYTKDATAFTPSAPIQGGGGKMQQVLPPWSITVIDARLQ
jgi:hypothetical protein